MCWMTEKDGNGNWTVGGIAWKDLRPGKTITREMYNTLYGALCKLRDYEDTGVQPDEIDEMQFEENK